MALILGYVHDDVSSYQKHPWPGAGWVRREKGILPSRVMWFSENDIRGSSLGWRGWIVAEQCRTKPLCGLTQESLPTYVSHTKPFRPAASMIRGSILAEAGDRDSFLSSDRRERASMLGIWAGYHVRNPFRRARVAIAT